jgi:hypothetical protein
LNPLRMYIEPLPMIYRSPYPWYIELTIHGILIPLLKWYIDPHDHGILTPYQWYIEAPNLAEMSGFNLP